MGFLTSKLSGYLAVAMGSLVLVLSVSLWFANSRYGKAQEKLGKAQSELAQSKADMIALTEKSEKINQSNLKTITTCKAINAENAAQRLDVDKKAQVAIAKAREFENKLAIQEMEYEKLSTQMWTQMWRLDDPLDDPLDDDLVVWMCEPEVNCLNRNGSGAAGQGSDSAGSQEANGANTRPAVSTRRLANTYKQTVGSLMICNDRLVRIAELVK